MSRKRFLSMLLPTGIMTFSTILILCVVGCSIRNFSGDETQQRTQISSETTVLPTVSPIPESTDTPTPTPTPTVKDIVVSFAGDCTFGQNVGLENNSNSFFQVVGTDYSYPFKNAVDVFSQDDMTLVNLEGTLTNSTTAREKEFAFRGPPEYVNILLDGSVEAVNLANNHTYDYWETGLQDTEDTLDSAGIAWSNDTTYAVYETNGVKIGMAGFCFPSSLEPIYAAIDALRSQGCEIVIISVHAGVERMYEPEESQVAMAHAIIDYGADIYVGHHPHRLQPIELYHGKYILYSLSNLSFGGQPYLSAPETAIVQCTFSVENGSVIGYKLNVIPFCMTTTYPGNDYCPVAYEPGSDGYELVMERLQWSDELNQTVMHSSDE